MARLSPEEIALNDSIMSGAQPDFDIADGMSIAVDEAIRRSPMAAVARRVQTWTDQSGKLDPMEANARFGLEGTEAAFQPDDTDVTEDRARSVAKDYHALRKNEYITELVNEESPMMGRATQFVASMGAGFVDPSLLATNVAGSMLIGKAVSSLASSAPAINFIGNRVSPKLGRTIMNMYDMGVRKSVGEIMLREGLENFAGSVIEETVNFMGVGEERLARKVSAQESLMNIASSTVIGGAFGTVGASDSPIRKAIFKKFGRKYGDDAADVLKASNIISETELQNGLPRSDFETRIHERESFEQRPWQKDSYTFIPMSEHTGKTFFIPLDEDGAAHSGSYRGAGTVLTDNVVHAQNKGVKYVEVNADNLRILRRDGVVNAEGGHTTIGRELADRVHGHIIENADPESLSKILVKYGDGTDAVELTPEQASRLLKEALAGKDIDEMLDLADDLVGKSGSKYDVNKAVDDFLEDTKWNGYQYTVKKQDGSGAYNGLYVKESATKKLQKTSVKDSPSMKTATFQQREQWNLEQRKLLENYDTWSAENRGKLRDTAPQPKPEGETPDPSVPKSDIETRGLAHAEDLAKLEAEIVAKQQPPEPKADGTKVEPVELSEKEVEMANFAREKLAGKSIEDMEKSAFEKVRDFWSCMTGR